MPVYLFTFHAYRSWMPDRGRGYVRRDEGVLPRDEEMAEKYRERSTNDPTTLTREIQKALVQEWQTACQFQRLRFHGGSTEPSHVHGITSWRDEERTTLAVRAGIKKSLSIRLTKLSAPDRQLFLSGGASQKRVKDNAHLTHLLEVYLPKHRGVAWFEDRGWIN
jgi:predicted phage gp36 major capsid-like protein